MSDTASRTDWGLEARRLVRANQHGALSTLSAKLGGMPFGSIAPYVADHDGCPVILLSQLAEHTRNLQADPRCSLLAHPCADDAQAAGRVTLAGRALDLGRPPELAARYLRHLPQAEPLLGMSDFSLWKIQLEAVRLIAGFGRIHWVAAPDYLADGAALATAEPGLLDWASSEPDLLWRIAGRNRVEAQQVTAVGFDLDGVDLRADGRLLRVDFPAPVSDADAVRSAALELAQR